MTLQSVPGYVSDLAHPTELDRNLLKGLFRQTGRLRYGDFTVTPGAGSGQLNISAGAASIAGQEDDSQGSYFAWSEDDETAAVTLPDPSGQPRYDAVLLRIADSQYGTVPSTSMAYWDYVMGVPAGSPTVLADSWFQSGGGAYVPGGFFRVCDVLRAPGDTTVPIGQIYPTYTHVSPIGGYIFCRSNYRPATPLLGDRIYEVDTKLRYEWNGSAWKCISPVVCRVKRAAAWGLGTSSIWQPDFDTSVEETISTMWDVGTPSRIYCRVDGLYLVHAYFPWEATTASGVRQLWVEKNGATTYLKNTMSAANGVIASGVLGQTLVAPISLVAGDYIEVQAWQNSGILVSATGIEVSMHLIRG